MSQLPDLPDLPASPVDPDAPSTMFVQPPISQSHLVDTVSGEIYYITGNVTTMGRGVRNKIVLNDKGISRVHCRIERAPTGFRLVDISSTNGTFVNEQRITNIPLHRGDIIRMGGLILRFET